jgi:hypothetical protein
MATLSSSCRNNSNRKHQRRTANATQTLLSVSSLAAALSVASVLFAAGMAHTTAKFESPQANTGTVTHTIEDGKSTLRVSADFKVPDTPARIWRVVDSKSNILHAGRFQDQSRGKRVVVVPCVHDIVKVQVYCAWAEVLLGETSFSSPVS